MESVRLNLMKPKRMRSISITMIATLWIAISMVAISESQVGVDAFVSQPLLASRSSHHLLSSSTTRRKESIIDRFTSPKIDDPVLPLTEAGIAQVVAPSLQLLWLASARSAFPTWTTPIYDYTFVPRGALLAPTLVHGAGLACCWLLGCLAVKGYERETFEADLPQVFWTTIKAGAFACGCLIFATQIDLYQEMGGYVQIGDSPETDLRINLALIEVINDIFFEATTLLAWRALRSQVDKW